MKYKQRLLQTHFRSTAYLTDGFSDTQYEAKVIERGVLGVEGERGSTSFCRAPIYLLFLFLGGWLWQLVGKRVCLLLLVDEIASSRLSDLLRLGLNAFEGFRARQRRGHGNDVGQIWFALIPR